MLMVNKKVFLRQDYEKVTSGVRVYMCVCMCVCVYVYVLSYSFIFVCSPIFIDNDFYVLGPWQQQRWCYILTLPPH